MTQDTKDSSLATTTLSRSVVSLFRLGTYRARLVAALIVVVGSFVYQTGAHALDQANKDVLYLDAPSISVPQAEKVGETARGYADPDSSVEDYVLAWVDVDPVPQNARKAFASVTDPGGQLPGAVYYEDAVAAGDTMVAQLGGDPPAGDDGAGEELAAADPVRPKLGDSTKAARDTPSQNVSDWPPASGIEPGSATGAGVQRANDTQEPEYAAARPPATSDLGLPGQMADEYASPEPATETPPAEEQPQEDGGPELASAPQGAGPISDDYSPEDDSPAVSDPAIEGTPGDEMAQGSSAVQMPSAEPETPGDEATGEEEASPSIVVAPFEPANPTKPEEPEEEYAEVSEDSGPEPSTVPSPADPESESEEPPEQEAEEPELVAISPHDSEAEEGEEDPGQEPSSEEGESSEPTSQGDLSEQAVEDTNDTTSEDIQVESGESESETQTLSVVVSQESEDAGIQDDAAPQSQATSGGLSSEEQRPRKHPSNKPEHGPSDDIQNDADELEASSDGSSVTGRQNKPPQPEVAPQPEASGGQDSGKREGTSQPRPDYGGDANSSAEQQPSSNQTATTSTQEGNRGAVPTVQNQQLAGSPAQETPAMPTEAGPVPEDWSNGAARRAESVAVRRAANQRPVQQTNVAGQDYAQPSAASYEDPIAQEGSGYVEDVAQDSYVQKPISPSVEDEAVGAGAAPNPTVSAHEPRPISQNEPIARTSENSASDETYQAPQSEPVHEEPVSQVPTQGLEPAPQVASQELEPAPQVSNTLVDNAGGASSGEANEVISPSTSGGEVAPTIDTAIQNTVTSRGQN